VLLALVVGGFNTLLGIGAWTWWTWDHLPAVRALEDWHPEQPLRIYAANGRLLQAIGPQIRFALPLAKIPKDLQAAFIAAETAGSTATTPCIIR